MNSRISTLLLPLGPIVFLLLPLLASAAPRIVDSAALAFHRNAFRSSARLADPPAGRLAPNGPPVHSPPLRVVNPVYSTAQVASSPPASSSATGDPIRVVLDRLLQHDGPIARSFARMFAAAQTPEQADPIASNPKELIAQPKHALNDAPAQPPGGDIEWKSILLGPKGILTSVFNEFKNKKLQEREKAKELQQQQPEVNPVQRDFAKLVEAFISKAKSGNFDEPLPELPFIGICNRLSCGDIYKAVDEFRKSDAFGNLQTALSLLSDEKGLSIIGEMLEKPELIESFVGNNGLPESGGMGAKRAKDEITSEDGDLGVDFSSLVDGQPATVTKEEKPMISANLDYYSSVDSGKTEEKAEETIPDHVDVEEVLPTTTPSGPPLPEISESIDELPMDYEGMTVEKTVDLPLPPAERYYDT